ncbi:hypothetical protein D047_3452A, partial [Vibrio parahaemolyticus VPTS-2010_2]
MRALLLVFHLLERLDPLFCAHLARLLQYVTSQG